MGVYKEGKNWKVQVYYKDWQGNQKRKQKRGFRTKGEAKEWERDFLQQQSQGVDIEFGNFLEIYYKDMDVRLREHTMYTKRYIIDLKIRPYFEKKILSEITVADVRAWQNELLMYKDKITIPPFLAEELKEYCSHLYGIMSNERMFRFTKSYMEHEIIRGVKETGVKRIRIHDLRHSHASLLVELGFQPLAIAERLGHEKIETTLNTYSHLYPNKQAELADRLELENEEDEL